MYHWVCPYQRCEISGIYLSSSNTRSEGGIIISMETSQYRVTNISEVSWGAMGKDTMGNTCNMGQLMRDCTTDRVIPTSGDRYGKGEEPTGFQNAPTEDEKQIGMSDLKN